MKIIVRGEIRDCEDCGSSHLGPRCHSTFAGRLQSFHLDPRALPNKDKHNYFDDEGLKDVFGLDKNERKEQMLEDTGGHGYFDHPNQMTPEAADYFFGS